MMKNWRKTMRKIINLISAILGMICGISILVLAITEIKTPKAIWFIFALCNFLNAIFIMQGNDFRRKNKN